MEEERLTIGEAAKYLQVSVDTLRRWDASGKLSASRSAGGHRYYLLSDLKRFLAELDAVGEAWATSWQPPNIPEEYYCETSDRFSASLNRFGRDLSAANALPGDLVSLVVAVAGEIGENSFAHNLGNWPDVPGVYFAYDIQKRLVVLADRGQGVLKTLRRVKPELDNDREALVSAFTEFISGRSPERRGNGLKFVREIMETNPIGLHFQSGIAEVNIPKEPGLMKVGAALRNIRGTFAKIYF
jgi:excisionase family DNA binding protein